MNPPEAPIRELWVNGGGLASSDEKCGERRLVQLGGLEPPTSCSTGRRSNQLSYNCIFCRPQKGVAEPGGN
jgi:hypothetical protein